MQTTDSAVLASAPAKENRALSANPQNTFDRPYNFTPAFLELFAIFLLEQVELARILALNREEVFVGPRLAPLLGLCV